MVRKTHAITKAEMFITDYLSTKLANYRENRYQLSYKFDTIVKKLHDAPNKPDTRICKTYSSIAVELTLPQIKTLTGQKATPFSKATSTILKK